MQCNAYAASDQTLLQQRTSTHDANYSEVLRQFLMMYIAVHSALWRDFLECAGLTVAFGAFKPYVVQSTASLAFTVLRCN
jgi:hypothetical protein